MIDIVKEIMAVANAHSHRMTVPQSQTMTDAALEIQSLRQQLADMERKLKAAEKDADRYRKVKTLTANQLKLWRGAYGCSDEEIDAIEQSKGGDE